MRRLMLLCAALALPAAPALAGGPKPCPPGLAKKGCVPPGQAKKYALGVPLDDRWGVIRDRSIYDLPPPPRGHRYAKVDRDIVLIAEATRRVVEVVAILEEVFD